ncbi:MAG: hypothetical protein IJL87_08185 [Clostridia bacterium]|nr:hypothetical protein [Clostridia bacterium]
MKDVSILVNTCDLYEDAWNPFFRLLQIQWKDCPKKVYLNTETKKYTDPYFDVVTVNSSPGDKWGARLLKAIDKIDTEYVFFFLEDFFIQKPVNTDILETAISCLDNEKDVGAIRFVPHVSASWCEKGTETYGYFSFIPLSWKARNTTMPSLWRKDYLKKITRAYESPWEFETFGSVRSAKMPYRVLVQNESAPIAVYIDYQIKYGYGISKRRWLKNNKELFDKYGIVVDFSRLGWFEESDAPQKVTGLRRSKKEKLLLPFTDPKLFAKILKAEFKQKWFYISHIRNRF